jgi:hypothetical protein
VETFNESEMALCNECIRSVLKNCLTSETLLEMRFFTNSLLRPSNNSAAFIDLLSRPAYHCTTS